MRETHGSLPKHLAPVVVLVIRRESLYEMKMDSTCPEGPVQQPQNRVISVTEVTEH
jgi:hypothetical protein